MTMFLVMVQNPYHALKPCQLWINTFEFRHNFLCRSQSEQSSRVDVAGAVDPL